MGQDIPGRQLDFSVCILGVKAGKGSWLAFVVYTSPLEWGTQYQLRNPQGDRPDVKTSKLQKEQDYVCLLMVISLRAWQNGQCTADCVSRHGGGREEVVCSNWIRLAGKHQECSVPESHREWGWGGRSCTPLGLRGGNAAHPRQPASLSFLPPVPLLALPIGQTQPETGGK